MSKTIYFVHLSDTHFGARRDFEVLGANPVHNASKVVQAIARLPVKPDFIVHTGDVTNDPSPEGYSFAEEIFSSLRTPIYYVTGNHDDQSLMRKHLTFGKHVVLLEQKLTYYFDKNGEKFVVLDGRGAPELKAQGEIGSEQLSALERELENTAGKVTLFVHFPALPLDCIWIEETMLLVDGAKLHSLLARYREHVRAVFFGHIHRGTTVFKDGVLYQGIASTVGQFNLWPADKKPTFDYRHPPSFNLVTIKADALLVKEHALVLAD